MGLGFSFCDAYWSYTSFHRFRCRVAEAIGIKLDEMSGFGGDKSWAEINSPLAVFLDHSDCEGELSPSQCALMIEPLKKIVLRWPESDYDRVHGLLLVEGMERAVKTNQHLQFM
jgi:hypothetical protein